MKAIRSTERIRVDPIRHFYNIISAFYGDLAKSLHYSLRRRLARKGWVPVVYCCGYDWRQDNFLSAQRLASVIEEAQRECDGEPIILIAHSMGGLVSRYFCKHLQGESKVRALFLLGSPTLGAVKAYRDLRCGLPFGDSVRRILSVTAGQTRELMVRMISAFQLLPNAVYCRHARTAWAEFDPTKTGFRDKAPEGNLQDPSMAFRDNSNALHFYRDIYTGVRNELATRELATGQLMRAVSFHLTLTIDETPICIQEHIATTVAPWRRLGNCRSTMKVCLFRMETWSSLPM